VTTDESNILFHAPCTRLPRCGANCRNDCKNNKGLNSLLHTKHNSSCYAETFVADLIQHQYFSNFATCNHSNVHKSTGNTTRNVITTAYMTWRECGSVRHVWCSAVDSSFAENRTRILEQLASS